MGLFFYNKILRSLRHCMQDYLSEKQIFKPADKKESIMY